MKDILKKIGLVLLLLLLAIIFGRFTYWMEDKYGNEWLWTLVRLSPIFIMILYLGFKKKK